jgi:Excalibur calcium-binding domain
MKKLVVIVVVAAVLSFMAARHHASPPGVGGFDSAGSPPSNRAAADPSDLPSRDSRCDGRTFCSQMTSCEEAKYFLNHCPNTKMDGDHDGVPCEQQWCKGG